MWYSGCKGLVQGTSPSHLPRGHLPGPSGALAGSPLLPRGRQEVERVKVQGGKTDERQGMFESSKTPSESHQPARMPPPPDPCGLRPAPPRGPTLLTLRPGNGASSLPPQSLCVCCSFCSGTLPAGGYLTA
uniref:Uncharacterized protein n=1 Tax=Rangifer tarandus platyrhynchus TaxID=3082113 RepID=A0ACB0F5J1_RANTA|nr:unnamed protein product [Rangifer tarandus platyrhynchus]